MGHHPRWQGHREPRLVDKVSRAGLHPCGKAVPPVKYLMDCSHVAAITKRVKMPPKLGHDFPRGGIIGTAEIVDCVEASDSPWFFGRYGFVLRSVKPIGFIPVKGALGFFDWRKNLPAQGAIQ